jgi:hypothetical protein
MDTSSILSLIITVIGIFIPAIIFIPLFSFFSLATLFICHRDKINLPAAFKTVWGLCEGCFFSTWLYNVILLAVTYLLILGGQILILFIYMLPEIITTGTFSFSFRNINQNTVPIVGIAYTIITFGIVILYQIAGILYFGNLEEFKEGIELKKKIELT